jgi:hypothetical protein
MCKTKKSTYTNEIREKSTQEKRFSFVLMRDFFIIAKNMNQNQLRQAHAIVWLLSPTFIQLTSEWSDTYGISSLKRAELEADGARLTLTVSHSQWVSKSFINDLKDQEEIFMKIIRKNLHKYKLPRIKWIVSTSNDDPVNLVALIESLNAGNNEQKVEQIDEES